MDRLNPMKTLLLVLALAFVTPLATTSCNQVPSARVIQVQTLKSVGQGAEAIVALSAQLYRDGRITGAQARQILDHYDGKFQPAYRVAVTAVQSNLDSFASAEVLTLANQLSALLTQFQTR